MLFTPAALEQGIVKRKAIACFSQAAPQLSS